MIEKSDVVLAILSPSYFQSAWCQQETAAAAASKVPIIPVMVEPCEVQGFLKNYNWADLTSDLEDLYSEFILPVLADCKLDCARGDDILGSNVVMDDVKAAIAKAGLVIADLSGQNPNDLATAACCLMNTRPLVVKDSWRGSENTFWMLGHE